MATNKLSQFLRIESFARTPSTKKKRSGQRSAVGIASEAAREPKFCKHVANAQPPMIVHGSPMDTLRKALEMASEARDARGHRLRKDAHILAGCVTSYPVSVAQVARSSHEKALLTEWVMRVRRWAFQEFGHQHVGAIVLHADESHPHLHILITPPEPGMEPSPLRRAAKEALKLAGRKNPKRHEFERKAYRAEAMRLQASFFEAVSRSFAHIVSTHGRRRLTRAEWLYPWHVRARNSGLSLAVRAPLNVVGQHRNATFSRAEPLPSSRQSEDRSQLATNPVPALSSHSTPAPRAKSWRGDGVAGNQAHTRALSAFKRSATAAQAITGTAPDGTANFSSDDSGGLRDVNEELAADEMIENEMHLSVLGLEKLFSEF
jgi:hypothetical protein